MTYINMTRQTNASMLFYFVILMSNQIGNINQAIHFLVTVDDSYTHFQFTIIVFVFLINHLENGHMFDLLANIFLQ